MAAQGNESCSWISMAAQGNEHIDEDASLIEMLQEASNNFRQMADKMAQLVPKLANKLEENEQDIRELREILEMETQEKEQLRREIEEIKHMNLRSEEIEQLMRIERDEYLNQIQVANERSEGLKRENSELKTSVKDLTAIAASKEDLIESLQTERDNFAIKAAELCIQRANIPSSSAELNFEFSLQELEQATQNFSESLKIGGGGCGSVYKGSLRQTTVAIKLLHTQSLQSISQFQQEITVLTKVRHPNLVNLIGACSEVSALVYEYLSNGSLEDRLTCANSTPPLTWQARTRIIGEICLALIFLHSNKPQLVVHGDLKPENILLDTNLVSKLSDFGISRLLQQPDSNSTAVFQTNNPAGTFAYMDPEYLSTGNLRPKSDTYSFGIIILRLLTGLQPLNIARRVQDALRDGTFLSVIDKSAGTWPFEQAKQLATIALSFPFLSSSSPHSPASVNMEAAADGDHDARTPLISSCSSHPLTSSPPPPIEDEIRPWQPSEPQAATASGPSPPARFETSPAPAKSPRLVSLDVFRGLTVAIMILVDDAGGAFPSINHAPWFGVTLADYVMPSFLFIIGVSIALVFKKISNKLTATKKVIGRTIKLFLLGLIIQGGFFHGHNNLTYGVDIDRIRLFGVLQRIAIGYFLAAISEIWLVRNVSVDSALSFVRKYYFQWTVAVVISMLYVGLLLGLHVPDWEFQVQSNNSNLKTNGTVLVQCGVRGSLDPPCNAVGLVDRVVLGQNHLYMHPVFRRTKECSVNSPDYGPLPSGAPGWCSSPFDPEGVLSTIMAAVTCFVGLQFGHILIHYKGHHERIFLWSLSSLILVILAFAVQFSGMPFSKPLYTVSYMFITAGVSGFALTFIYFVVDIIKFSAPLVLFQWMGLNALIVFILAASEVFPIFLQGFYWQSPSYNLVSLTEAVLQKICHSKRWGTLAFVLLEVLFWGLVAGVLHIKGIYYKL